MDDTNVILVDSKDTEIGTEEKLRAHKGSGKLHRAVSVLVFRVAGGKAQTLMQKRSSEKLLWPGFWTNTICTHPLKNESYKEAGARRLYEEMGIRIAADLLTYGFRFEYQAQYSPEFSEHELDTVLFLLWDGVIQTDVKEADDSKWIKWEDLLEEIKTRPSAFTPWFQQIVNNFKTIDFVNTI